MVSSRDSEPTEPGEAADSTVDSLLRAVAATPAVRPSKALQPGDVVDASFEILSLLGQGGMGTVYLARDLRLGRSIALKVHRLRAKEGANAELREEAQAMAQVGHPNVVSVNRVGTVDGRLYIAMEYVEGTTLREWMDAKHSWRAVVRMFIGVARGLAAAHAAGLVHRDFKPANVLIGSSGRPRVADFGLARAVVTAPSTPELGSSGSDAAYEQSDGKVEGTPSYMSPEQVSGEPLDGRSDQYSFCVALYETLYGRRPHGGKSVWELMDSIASGRVRPPPKGPEPRWLRRAVLRGLSPEPADRFESMDALANTMRRGLRARSFGVLLGAAAVSACGVAAALLWPQADERCDELARRFDGVWDKRRAAEVVANLEASDSPAAAAYAEDLTADLDAWTREWTQLAVRACEAGGPDLDPRMDCLRGAAEQLAAAAELLEAEDPLTPEAADNARARLPPISDCADDSRLAARMPPPSAEQAADVGAIRGDLVRISILSELGRTREAGRLAHAAVTRTREVGYRPLEAEALFLLGRLQHLAGEWPAAQTSLADAYHLASELGYERVVVGASSYVVANEALLGQGSEQWLGHARAALDRSGSRIEDRIELLNAIGNYELHRGNFALAGEHHRAALALVQSAAVPDPPALARAFQNISIVLRAEGEYEEAYAYLQRALVIEDAEAMGSRGNRAYARHNLGVLASEMGRTQEARAYFVDALAQKEEWLGPAHPSVASTLDGLGGITEKVGQIEDARKMYQRGLEIRQAALGMEHPDLAGSHINLASAYEGLKAYEKSVEHSEAALALLEASVGRGHPNVGIARNNLGLTYIELRRYEDAERELTAALANWEAALGPDHPLLPNALVGRGHARMLDGRIGDALPDLRRALKIAEAQPVGDAMLGEVRLRLGQALSSSDPAAAKTLLEQARANLEAAGDGGKALLAELAASSAG